MSITLADVVNAEKAVEDVHEQLKVIGRELYRMRKGTELSSVYAFERYCRWEYMGPEYSDQEGPEWEIGTPIFSVVFYWSDGERKIVVTFPQSWLDKDWRSLEKARFDKEEAARVEEEKAEAERREAQQEAAERQTYERLKAKFEGGAATA